LLHRRGATSPLQNELALVQFVQRTPPAPQAWLAMPVAQVLLFWQQPKGQLAAPHLSRHCRAWQTWPAAVQSAHWPPPVAPQALSNVPTTQVLPEQQPVGQVSGPHPRG
jgi:hypothetical protein